MPNSEATARGHLRKTPTAQPHAQSEAVSALRRHYQAAILQEAWRLRAADMKSKIDPQFDPTKVPRSTTLHFDYIGALPERCSAGTLYFMVSCWGSYIHLEPLHSLKGAHTAQALEYTVVFYRSKGVLLDGLRLDNQSSPELRATAAKFATIRHLVPSNQKEANRSERAIQTAKSHVIATRAGFHRDFPQIYLDKCLTQIELTLNVLHPFANLSVPWSVWRTIRLHEPSYCSRWFEMPNRPWD
jgi:hypothetical protein